MAGSSPRAAGTALLLLLAALPVAAQQPIQLDGRVLRRMPGDTLPLTGARVVLHRVGQEIQGPLDSVRSGPDGRFRFRFSRDTTAIHLVSARHHGIEYFSDAILVEADAPLAEVIVVVADTSSAGDITVAGRYLVIGAPDTERRRTAVDLIVLMNAGTTTRVGADTLVSTWSALLPPGALGHRVPEMGSEISADAVRFRGDTVDVLSPLSPGGRQLLLEHRLPADLTRLVVPLADDATPVQVVTEESGATVTGAGMTPTEPQVIDGRSLTRWIGQGGPGAAIIVTFPSPGQAERTAVLVLVGGMALLLGAGLWLGLRRRVAGRSPRP